MGGTPRRRWSHLAIAGLAVLASVCALHLALEGRVLFDTEPWSPNAQRIALTVATAAAIVLCLYGLRLADRPHVSGDLFTRRLPEVALSLAVVPMVVVLFSPAAFDVMSREDHPVELLSAAANFFAAGTLVVAWSRWRWRGRGLLVAAAGVFAFIGLEEVSWFQRILRFESPSGFELNDQGEVNVHNFATDAFQSMYYLGAVVLMVAVPYLAACCGAAWPAALKVLVPGRLPLTLTVAATPYNYAETSYLASHLAFWLAAVALVLWPADGALRRWSWVLLTYLVAAQAVMFLVGPRLLRDWGPSEYRELLIAAAFAAWAVELLRRISGGAPTPPIAQGRLRGGIVR